VPRITLEPGAEPQSLGVGNRTAIFRDNYLEILGVVDPERWAAIPKEKLGPFDIDKPMRRYEGLHVMHFGTDDLAAVKERYEREGVLSSDIRPFQRPVDTPEGSQTMLARSLSFPPGADPEALVQVAQHLTPELVLQPHLMRHPNEAKSVTEIVVCAGDPAPLAAKYGRYTGPEGQGADGLHVLDLGRSRVTVVSPDRLDDVVPGCVPPTLPFLAAFTVAADLVAARGALKKGGVPFGEHGGRLIVVPEDACGSAVLFEAEGAARQ
jgi:hypothetical protein